MQMRARQTVERADHALRVLGALEAQGSKQGLVPLVLYDREIVYPKLLH